MSRPSSYPPEVRERAVRMVAETKCDYPVGVHCDPIGGPKVGDRFAGDATQVDPSCGDRCGQQARAHHTRVRADQGVEEGERGASPGE